MTRHPAWKTSDLPPATVQEVTWAEEQMAGGYTNDFMARGIRNAETEDEALKFIKYHHSMSGGCCSTKGPNNIGYWYELIGGEETGHFWFGREKERKRGGDPDFIPGDRYVAIKYRDLVRKVRSADTSPGLF